MIKHKQLQENFDVPYAEHFILTDKYPAILKEKLHNALMNRFWHEVGFFVLDDIRKYA